MKILLLSVHQFGRGRNSTACRTGLRLFFETHPKPDGISQDLIETLVQKSLTLQLSCENRNDYL